MVLGGIHVLPWFGMTFEGSWINPSASCHLGSDSSRRYLVCTSEPFPCVLYSVVHSSFFWEREMASALAGWDMGRHWRE